MITVEKRDTPLGPRWRASWRTPEGRRRSVQRASAEQTRAAARRLRQVEGDLGPAVRR